MAVASDWLELDSPVEGFRFDSELALRQEIAYASYLSIATIILPPPRLDNHEFLSDYARAINGALASSWHINVRFPDFLFFLSSHLYDLSSTSDRYPHARSRVYRR
jgi:hypothetical protein